MSNFYPEQLRQLAVMCDALNKADDPDLVPNVGMGFMLGLVPVLDESQEVVGHLSDEVGGAYSFTPVGNRRAPVWNATDDDVEAVIAHLPDHIHSTVGNVPATVCAVLEAFLDVKAGDA